MSSIPAPASEAEAVQMVLTGLSRLAAADPTAMAAQAQAECLLALEQGDAMSTAVRARFLAAFTAGRGYSADGDYSPASWLIHQTRVTRGAARGHLAWARRAGRHPRVVAALAEGGLLTESVARVICGWTGRLPADCQDAADEILVGAALAGGRQEDLAVLAAEIYIRSLPAGDDNPATTTTSRFISGAGPSPCIPTAPPPSAAPTAPKSSEATDHPGNPGPEPRRTALWSRYRAKRIVGW